MIDKTFEELTEYRQEDGYINLDKILLENNAHDIDSEREVRGNENREKDWIKLKEGEVLVKTNLQEKPNSEYSELISCALAKQAGIETAKYDMIKYKGEPGLITKNVCKKGDEMISLCELIGNGPDNEEYPDIIDIYHVFDSLDDKLQIEGFDDNEIDECLLSLRKQLLFDLCIMESDRHLENLSLIFSNKDGKRIVRFAPMYDTEAALVLHDTTEDMKKIYTDIIRVAQEIEEQEPKISIIPEEDIEEQEDISKALLGFFEQLQMGVKPLGKEEFANVSEEMWKRTFDFLCEDERAMEYWQTTLSKMDIVKAVKDVEKQINVKLPEHIQKMATACFKERLDAMDYRIPSGRNQVFKEQKNKDEDIVV